jgi:hypothetical protein
MCQSRAIVDVHCLGTYFTADAVRSNPLRFTGGGAGTGAARFALTGRCGASPSPSPISCRQRCVVPDGERRSTHF